jgi:hypothetical protein
LTDRTGWPFRRRAAPAQNRATADASNNDGRLGVEFLVDYMNIDLKKLTAAVLLAGGIALVYWHVFQKLVYDWTNDGNYSHGFLIPPLALYFAWERRHKLASLDVRPAWFGLVVFVGSILVLLAGVLGSELFLMRISLLGVLTGTILFLFGWRHLQALIFPVAFFLLIIYCLF